MFISRRDFIRVAGTLTVSAFAPAAQAIAAQLVPNARNLNAWVAIDDRGLVSLALAHSEMGQGITTTLPSILAEELGADFETVSLVTADVEPAFRHPVYQWMFTGNSESIATYTDIVRLAGAAAREMLIMAAAKRWQVDPAGLSTRHSYVVESATRRQLRFAALVDDASTQTPPKSPKIRADTIDKVAGRARQRIDTPAKVDGSAVFGIDVKVPGMLYAAVRRSPSICGSLRTLDEAAITAQPGVVRVVKVPGGFAVVADRWWRAKLALDAGNATWQPGAFAGKDTDGMLADHRAAMTDGPFKTVKTQGDAAAALAAGNDAHMSVLYTSPFQAHATMEPMNCTVHVTSDRCEIWAPTQGMDMVHMVAKQVTGLPEDAIVIHRTFLGGGFGRRLLGDFIKQAILIARDVEKPVKMVWAREEDFAQDLYRPAQMHQIDAVLGADGLPRAMTHRVVSPSMLLYAWPRNFFPNLTDATEPVDPPESYDLMPVEGVIEPLYDIPNYRVDFLRLKTKLPVSVWRTTGHGPNNFALESFIDEAAHAAGRDPLAYRRALLARNPRALRLLNALVETAALDRPPPSGQSRGIAIAQGFGSLIAQAVTLSVERKAIKFHRVVSVVDLGRVLDPGISTRNIEGGIIWGLSALRTEMPFEDGAAAITNFDHFDPLHLWETPKIETRFLDSGEKLGGVGEIGPVPTLAAVGNAIFLATGERLRSLPISRAGYSIV